MQLQVINEKIKEKMNFLEKGIMQKIEIRKYSV